VGRRGRVFSLESSGEYPGGSAPARLHFVVSPLLYGPAGIALIAGRGFTESDNANAPAVTLICEVFARRYFPNGDAIGKQVSDRFGRREECSVASIVGIVRSVKINTARFSNSR